MARKANAGQRSVTRQEVERAVRLVNAAKRQNDEAQCRLLSEAINLLMRRKKGAQMSSEMISIPTTGVAGKLEVLLEDLLAHPSQRLAVYGTLAPGESHHPVIAGIHGTWQRGWVSGVLGRIGPYPAFHWRPREQPIAVQVLSSTRPPPHWARLDRFEGDAYRRILVPVTSTGGVVQAANLYRGVAFT